MRPYVGDVYASAVISISGILQVLEPDRMNPPGVHDPGRSLIDFVSAMSGRILRRELYS
jgi:hypothetical protein